MAMKTISILPFINLFILFLINLIILPKPTTSLSEKSNSIEANIVNKRNKDTSSAVEFRSTFSQSSIISPSYPIVPLVKNNKIDTIIEYPAEFVLSFILHPFSTVNEWTNVLRITDDSDSDCCNYADRWIGVWCTPYSYVLSFAAGTVGNGNPSRNIYGVEGNKDNYIKIEAIGSVIKFFINGKHNATLPNTDRPPVTQLDIYASDNFFPAANASIRDFVFTNYAISSSPSLLFTAFSSTTTPTPIATNIPSITYTSTHTSSPTQVTTVMDDWSESKTSSLTIAPTFSFTNSSMNPLATNVPNITYTSTNTSKPTQFTTVMDDVLESKSSSSTIAPTFSFINSSINPFATNIPTITYTSTDTSSLTQLTTVTDDWFESKTSSLTISPTIAPTISPTVAPTISPAVAPTFSFINSSIISSVLKMCHNVVQRGYIIDNISWANPNHAGISNNISLSKNPYYVTTQMLLDSSAKGYGLVIQNGDTDEFVYKYNFTKVGKDITLEYLLNEKRRRGFEIYAVGRYCYHNDSFLLSDIERYEFDSSSLNSKISRGTILGMVIATSCCITLTYTLFA